jgi:uncharacterized protein DUF2750
MNDKEYQTVLDLPGSNRYSYTIKKIADQEEVWSLWIEGGWALASDDEGRELIPIWPRSKFASACATGEWNGYVPRSIDLASWTSKWVPGIARDQRKIVVFPTPNDKGVVVSPEQFSEDIETEISLYE